MEQHLLQERDVSLLNLVPELLEAIVLSPVLSIPDVFRLSGVCRLLHETVSRQWEKLARNRWSNWDDALVGRSDVDWRLLVSQRYLCERHLRTLLDSLMKRGICAPLLDDYDLRGFTEMVETGVCSAHLLDCVLKDFLSLPPKRANLTHQFYSLYGREYLHRKYLEGKWNTLLELPEAQQHLEAGAILLAQWMNPWDCPSSESIMRELDGIATLVAEKIIAKRATSLETASPAPSSPSVELMDQVCGLGLDPCTVLDELNGVLYGQLGFGPPSHEEYYNEQNSYIDKVLKQKKGLPITMSIVYHCVARRLGITLQPVNFPSHFLLKLEPSQGRGMAIIQDAIFIDAYNHGTRRTRVQCLELLPVVLPNASSYFTVAAFIQVFLRMAGNLCSNSTLVSGMELHRTYDEQKQHWGCVRLPQVLSLQLFLCRKAVGQPFVLDYTTTCCSLCLNLGYSPNLIVQLLNDIIKSGVPRFMEELRDSAKEAVKKKEELCSSPSEPKNRVPGLKYRVGMIVMHTRYNYRCVIYGWDESCEMSESWMIRMRVDQLQMGRRQPFYHVLVEDGTTRYAAQENLEPCTMADLPVICHWELGKYFVSFTGRGYVPNEALRSIYHEDCT